jgi:hypothetical protein
MVDSCENVTLDDNEKATIFSEQEPNVWNGYFEWELNEEKRVLAAKMMSTKTFPKPPGEFIPMTLEKYHSLITTPVCRIPARTTSQAQPNTTRRALDCLS